MHSFLLCHAHAGFKRFQGNAWPGENIVGCCHEHAVQALNAHIEQYHVPIAVQQLQQAGSDAS
jgi:hypothetical protein